MKAILPVINVDYFAEYFMLQTTIITFRANPD